MCIRDSSQLFADKITVAEIQKQFRIPCKKVNKTCKYYDIG